MVFLSYYAAAMMPIFAMLSLSPSPRCHFDILFFFAPFFCILGFISSPIRSAATTLRLLQLSSPLRPAAITDFEAPLTPEAFRRFY